MTTIWRLGHSTPGARLLELYHRESSTCPFERSTPSKFRNLCQIWLILWVIKFSWLSPPLSHVLLHISFAFCVWRCFRLVSACRSLGICTLVHYSGCLSIRLVYMHIHSTVLGVARTSTIHFWWSFSLLLTFRVSGTMTDRLGSGAHFYDSLLVVILLLLTFRVSGTMTSSCSLVEIHLWWFVHPNAYPIAFPCVEHDASTL